MYQKRFCALQEYIKESMPSIFDKLSLKDEITLEVVAVVTVDNSLALVPEDVHCEIEASYADQVIDFPVFVVHQKKKTRSHKKRNRGVMKS